MTVLDTQVPFNKFRIGESSGHDKQKFDFVEQLTQFDPHDEPIQFSPEVDDPAGQDATQLPAEK